MFLRLKLRNSPCGLTNITHRILWQVTFWRKASTKCPFLLKISQYTIQSLQCATHAETRSFPSAYRHAVIYPIFLKNPPLIEEQIGRHHKETNKSRSWHKTTSLVSSKVNVMKTGEMVLGFKTLVRHNNQMQYVNLGWILVQKKKKKNIWNQTHQEQSGKLSMRWILVDIWELL